MPESLPEYGHVINQDPHFRLSQLDRDAYTVSEMRTLLQLRQSHGIASSTMTGRIVLDFRL